MSVASDRVRLIPELADLRAQFEQIQADAARLAGGISNVQFNWSPAPGRWSIAQCLGHLVIAGEWQRKAVDAAVEAAVSRGLTGNAPFRYGMVDQMVLRLTRSKRRFWAPRRFHPAADQSLNAVIPTFLHLQSQFMDRVERSNGLDLGRVTVSTPFTRMLRLSLGTVYAQVAAHEQRHLAQAWAVREHPDFPK